MTATSAPTTGQPIPATDVLAPASAAGMSAGLRRLIAAGLACVTFGLCFFLYTRHLDAPLRYHPDEPGKVEQVIADHRNHNHPTMMLDLTRLAVDWLKIDEEPSAVVRTGRGVSAGFAAGCVTFLAIAGFLEAGVMGMVLVALLVGASPFLFTYAHYMKEDAGLLFGLGMVLLAARMVWVRWRHWWKEIATVLLLGIACAVAASGKYIGAASVIVGWLILFCGNRWRWSDMAVRPLVFAAAAYFCAWGINYRVIDEWLEARDNVARSVRQPLENQFNSVCPIPNTYYLHIINEVTPLPVKVLGAASVVLLVLTWRRRNGWDVLLVVVLLVVVGLLCFACRLAFPRYALPAVVQLHLLAALALAWTWEWINARPDPGWRRWAFAGVAVAAVGLSSARVANAYRQFSDDSRDRLMVWLNQNGKAGETAVADHYAGFRNIVHYVEEAQPEKVRVDGRMWAAGFGDLEDIKARGYSYIIVSDLAHARFTNGLQVPNHGQEYFFEHHRDWYNRLFKEGNLVWEARPEPHLHGYTNPHLRVYRLDGPAPGER